MKVKSFKTKTNNGTICKVEVILIDQKNIFDGFEDAVMIQTTRVVPRSEFESYNELNEKFPQYFAIKATENYVILVTRSATVKLSTFLKIVESVNELIKL